MPTPHLLAFTCFRWARNPDSNPFVRLCWSSSPQLGGFSTFRPAPAPLIVRRSGGHLFLELYHFPKDMRFGSGGMGYLVPMFLYRINLKDALYTCLWKFANNDTRAIDSPDHTDICIHIRNAICKTWDCTLCLQWQYFNMLIAILGRCNRLIHSLDYAK